MSACEALFERLAREPRRTAGIKRIELRPDDPGHVDLHALAVLRLQIGEVSIAFREAGEQGGVEPHRRDGIDRVDAVALVDRLAQHDAPAALALLQEVVEAAAADDVAGDAFDRAALRDLHLGLRDGAPALEVDALAALEVRRAGAAG